MPVRGPVEPHRGAVMRAMILAAGLGERMGALTRGRPKPLLRIGDETLIERQVRLLVAAGIADLVINLSYRGEQIRALLGDGSRHAARIVYSTETFPPFGTGGGIVHALPLLGDAPFIVVNSDVVSDYSLAELAWHALRPGLLGMLVLVPNPAHHRDGDFGIDARGLATLAPPCLTFAGISLLAPGLFADCRPGPGPLKPILDRAIDAGRIGAELYSGAWIDVGTPERLAQASAQFARNA